MFLGRDDRRFRWKPLSVGVKMYHDDANVLDDLARISGPLRYKGYTALLGNKLFAVTLNGNFSVNTKRDAVMRTPLDLEGGAPAGFRFVEFCVFDI